MKHFTFKHVGGLSSFFKDCVTPDTCYGGEFITIGNRNTIKVVFFASPEIELKDNETVHGPLGISTPETHCSVIQYNKALGGYLYAWFN